MKKSILAIFITMLVCTLGLCAFMGGKIGKAADPERGGSANGAHPVPSVPLDVVPYA